jgi:hypothetical protein
MNKKEAEMEKTKYITVTYLVCEDELVAIQELADQNGITLEEQFGRMMTVGSKWDIEKKIKFWQAMCENEKRSIPA